MGACGSNLSEDDQKKYEAQKKMNKEIEKQQKNVQEKEDMLLKLLLLGAGESGKSTLFKQMISLYGKGYTERERESYKPIIFQNTIGALKILVTHCEELKQELNTEVEEKNNEAAERLNALFGDEEVTEELSNDIKALWTDSGIQKTYENRSKFQFPDSGSYFFSRLDEMIKPDYIPSEQDVLRSRVRTTGIVETAFEIEGNQFRMFDVGGQRNERKKWIHCFENVTCVLFVAAISEYDQVLFEDESTNRVVEALNLFDEICNSRWFVKTSIILFLNKRDLFMEKIREVPLSVAFDDYNGPAHDYDNGCQYFREKFESRNRCPEKEVYSHVTCATDRGNVSHVFESVKDIIIKEALRLAEIF